MRRLCARGFGRVKFSLSQLLGWIVHLRLTDLRNISRREEKTPWRCDDCVGDAWATHVTWAGSDAVGRPLFAPRSTPRPLVQSLRDAFGKLEGDKDFLAELRKVGGDDADLLLAKDAEPVLRQVLTVSPGVQEFVKAITKKHLQR
jgi:hypothetical protein